jgi:glucokinase
MSHVLAADIGGTSMRAAVVSEGGEVVARRRAPTLPERGIADAAERLAMLLAEALREADVSVVGLGVSTAGPLDPATGTYRHPPNLEGWHGGTMWPVLEQLLAVPVIFGHDATLAAVAETRFGAGRGLRDLLYITVSTGIGGGIVANGAPVTGAQGGAGEVGHVIVAPGGRACGAGCAGCLEGVAAGPAIADDARQRLTAVGAESTLRAVAGGGDALTAADVFAAAAAGDALARDVIGLAIGRLGTGLAGLLATLDPALVVLGGGVGMALAAYAEELQAAVRAVALPRYAGGAPIAFTTLGDDVSLLGAAVVAFEAAGVQAGR